MPRKPRSNDALKLSIVPLLAASFAAGCGEEEETAYCVDQEDRVVENRYCDDEYDGVGGTGFFFWYFGGVGGNVRVGERVAGGERISASDRAALARRGGFGANSRGAGGGIGRTAGFSGSGGG